MNFFEAFNTELDQDKFFMWLLSSFDSNNEKEKNASVSFARLLVGESLRNEQIKNIKVIRQVSIKQAGRLDLLCAIETDDKTYLITIEDKIDTECNNAFDKYRDYVLENWLELMHKLGAKSNVSPEFKFVILKTGLHLSKNDERAIKKSNFALVKRDEIINFLEDNKEDNFFIEEFLAHLNFSATTLLNQFSCKKAYLATRLTEMLQCKIEFVDKEYSIDLFSNGKYILVIRDFSLRNPSLSFYIKTDFIINKDSELFRIVDSSKTKTRAKKIIELKDATLGCLLKELQYLIDEAKRLVSQELVVA